MKKGFPLIELLVVVAILGTIISIMLGAVSGFGFPFTGEQTGYITAVERGGMFGIPNVYIKTETESSQEDRYCITDTLYETAQELSREKELVTVVFGRGWFMPLWSCNSANYRITGIKS